MSTTSWEVTGVLAEGGGPCQPSARSAHLESAPQAEKILGPKQPFSMDFASESAETDKLGRTDCRTLRRAARVGLLAASCCSCCLGCSCPCASSLAVVLLA